MRIPGLVVVAVLAVVACKKKDPPPPTFERLERAAFAVDMPQGWKVLVDEGRPGLGKYKVERAADKSIVEVAWQGGEASTMEEMKAMVQAVLSGFELDGSIEQAETPEQLRVHATASLKGKVWTAMTVVTCKKTGVMVTLGATSRSRAVAESVGARVVESLQCRGDSPEGFSGTLVPAAALPEGFGIHREGESIAFAHADGRVLLALPGATDTIASVAEHPEPILTAIGQLLEQELRAVGKPDEAAGLAGVAQTRLQAVTAAGERPVVAATFVCPDSVQGYIVLALDEGEGNTDAAGLGALLAQIGCPGAPGGRTYRSACEVGAEAFCAEEPAPAAP